MITAQVVNSKGVFVGFVRGSNKKELVAKARLLKLRIKGCIIRLKGDWE